MPGGKVGGRTGLKVVYRGESVALPVDFLQGEGKMNRVIVKLS